MSRKFEPLQDIISPYAKSKLNNDFEYLFENLDIQGKSIQDLVAKGQLTPEQYATLIQSINGLMKSGNIKLSDIDFNYGKIEQRHLSDAVLSIMTGNAPVNATPADGSVSLNKLDVTLQSLITDFSESLTIENESWVV